MTAIMQTLAAFSLTACGSDFPDTPLLNGVGKTDFDTGRAMIERRLALRFRVGEPEKGLSDYLTSQGFKVKRMTNSKAVGMPVFGQALVTLRRPPCDLIVGVDWRASPDMIIRELKVRYSDVGCP